MDYAIQLLIPVIGGLMLGIWLTKTYGVPSIWTIVFAIAGMVAGIAIMYRRFSGSQSKVETYKPSGTGLKKGVKSESSGTHIKDLDFLYKQYDDRGDDWKELDDMDDEVSFDEPPGGYPLPPRKNNTEHHDL